MNSDKRYIIYMIILTCFISISTSLIVYKVASDSNKVSQINTSQTTNNTTTQNNVNLKSLEKNVKDIAKNISPSVVSIIISKEVQTYKTDPYGFFQKQTGTLKQAVGGGTGFFINKLGLILTNKHVVGDPNASYTVIASNGKEYSGKVLAIDPTNDLAIVQALDINGKALSNTPAVTFNGSASNIEVGSFVVAIGNALAEFQNTVTFGVISGIGRSIEAGDQNSRSSEQLTGLIQTDTAINPGNSGGPLVNLNEEVVGINTAIASGANGLGFAIPLSQKEVDYIISSVQKTGKIQRAFVGIRYIPLTPEIAKSLKIKIENGNYIGAGTNQEGVVAGSPAEKAGLKTGDIITEVNGVKLINGLNIKDIIKDKFPGDKISLKVLKSNGEEKMLELILGAF
ncbi:MAG: trypsin-like peptidase domain-containing protein [Candidatus Gracilibacteria bacterium]|nr:trypsin-like peptidase domain-containing protein [Candidatus Gracilibacteria bacterium]MDD2908406.1 trypsin-like peptidase domain-containing protein [Candidatus Gracilibacteria bacterium]